MVGRKTVGFVETWDIVKVLGTAVFYIEKSTRVNAGLEELAPKGAREAQNWTFYKYKYLDLFYKPGVSADTGGKVILGFMADSSQALPATEVNATCVTRWVELQSWTPGRLRIPAEFLNKKKYVDLSAAESDQADLRLKDVGRVFCAAFGQASAGNIGTVKINYVVEFDTIAQRTTADFNHQRTMVPVTGVARSVPFGTAAFTEGTEIKGDLPVYRSGQQILRFAKFGTFIVRFSLVGTGLTAVAPTLGEAGNAQVYALTTGSDAAIAELSGGLASQHCFVVAVPDDDGTISWDFTPSATTVSALTVNIKQGIPSDFAQHATILAGLGLTDWV
jgi:hypothetical protein